MISIDRSILLEASDPSLPLAAPDLADALASDLTLIAPQTLERRLSALIREYVRARSASLAQSVVRHIEALCLHPDNDDPALFCAYQRLAVHWRWLAAQHGSVGT
jgi:hypothetical protein